MEVALGCVIFQYASAKLPSRFEKWKYYQDTSRAHAKVLQNLMMPLMTNGRDGSARECGYHKHMQTTPIITNYFVRSGKRLASCYSGIQD